MRPLRSWGPRAEQSLMTRPAPRRRLVAALTSLATVLSAPVNASGISAGQPDGDGHPNVVAILGSSGVPICTGVYVAATPTRNVVLTDAHCLYRRGLLAGTTRIAAGPALTGRTTPMAGTFYIDPDYDPKSATADLAVIDLNQPLDATPATLAPIGTAPTAGVIEVVGYGQPYLGQRRYATETITGLDDRWLYLTARSGNSCSADSGAPDFLRSSNTVIALTDLGTCSTDQDTRVDTADAQAFIAAAATYNTDPPTLTAGISSPLVDPGDQVAVTGTTNRDFVGDPVLSQVLRNGTWFTLGAATVARGGQYTINVTADIPGEYPHRVVLPRTRTHTTGTADAATLAIREVTATAPLAAGDMENPIADPWRATGTVQATTIAHGGNYGVQVGAATATRTDSVLTQTFLADAPDTALSINYQIRCADTVRYDWTTITLTDDTTRTSTVILPRTCATQLNWQLTPPAPLTAGHTYTLIITTHDDGAPADPTYALIDDATVAPTLSTATDNAH